MKESQFNVFHQFAGCFVPHGLLSVKNLSAGVKLCYAVLAQQANARGTTQLNLPLLAASVGESERNAVRYLVELEEAGLIESSRGNVNKEDVRISFPRYPWLTQNAESFKPLPLSTRHRQPRKLSRDSSPSNRPFRSRRRKGERRRRKSPSRRLGRKGGSAGSDARARAIP